MENSFIRTTARAIIGSTDWKQLKHTTFVLPSHRAGLVLKNELLQLQQEQHAQAIWAPQVQTLTQLQDHLSPLYAEDELFTVVRLYKLYRELAQSGEQSEELMPLDMFYTFGRQMIADFTNIDASMRAEEVPNFFANTVAAHELSTWQLDPEVEERLRSLVSGEREAMSEERESIRAQYETLWRNLYTLYTRLGEEMRAEQKGYAGMRQRAVIAHWDDETLQAKIAGRTFVFVGFNYLLPVERELMIRLRDTGQARFYWDYVPDFQTNEKAFSFAQQNAQIVGNNGGESKVESQKTKAVTVVSCVSKEAQAQYVHRWLQENYTAKGQKVGVVICDETMLEPVIYALPAITLEGAEQPEPINITKGFPLRNTAVYARAITWLYDKKNGKSEELVSPAYLDAFLAALFPVKEEENPSPVTDNPSPLSWQELLVLESEYQVHKIANQMRTLVAQGLGEIPFTIKMLRLLMRRAMESVTMPFHGEPVTDIQVMGVLETRLLDFDRLLLLNVDEGILPQRQTDSSFIPFYLRKAYHMQTSDERATVYAYNFFRLLSRSGHTTLLYGQPDTIGGSRGMSRFIMQMLYSPEFEVTQATLEEPNEVQEMSSSAFPSTASSLLSHLNCDERGVLRRENGTRYRLSPSALNTYIACPRSFYLQYIEGLRPKEQEEGLFESNTIGSFVHHAVEYIYTRYLACDNTRPRPVSPDEIEAIIQDEEKLQAALMEAYRMVEERDGKAFEPNEHVSENVIIKGYVRNILERDKRDAENGLQIYLLEQERTFPLRVEGVGELLLGGTIDRLDIYGQPGRETLRVVDYKSGGYNDLTHAQKMSATWEEMMNNEDKAYVRQTMIYSHAVMHEDKTGLPIEPHLFFCRRNLNQIVTTLDVENNTVHDYRTIHQPFYETLATKIHEVLTTTSFPPCEPDKCPSFCPFYELCGRKNKEY